MKIILFTILISIMLFTYAFACFTDIAENAWVNLPANSSIIKRNTKKIFNAGLNGVETKITLKVSRNVFEQWKDSCRFIFEMEGDSLEFHWDSEHFMGAVTYNMKTQHLEIHALRYEK